MGKIYRKEFCDPDSIYDLQIGMSLFGLGFKGEHVIARDENGKKALSVAFQKENGRAILVQIDYINRKATQIAAEGKNGWWVRDASVFKPPAEEMQVRQV